jgi:hypothetical protein
MLLGRQLRIWSGAAARARRRRPVTSPEWPQRRQQGEAAVHRCRVVAGTSEALRAAARQRRPAHLRAVISISQPQLADALRSMLVCTDRPLKAPADNIQHVLVVCIR